MAQQHIQRRLRHPPRQREEVRVLPMPWPAASPLLAVGVVPGDEDGSGITDADLLPTLARVGGFGRESMRRRHAKGSLMAGALSGLPLELQQQAMRRLLRRIGQRFLDPVCVVQRTAPFDFVRTSPIVRHAAVGGPPLAGAPPGAVASQVVIVDWLARCMPHDQRAPEPGYLRVALCGRRTGSHEPVMEWVHRVVCYIARGPPPGNDWAGYEASHICSDPRCCNPMHMRWLTPAENSACRQWHQQQVELGRTTGWRRLWPGAGQ
jgi:hypothetical protein